MITQSELEEKIFYYPLTGNFIWRISIKGVEKGDIAGCFDDKGYRIIQIDNNQYKAHRLAWLYIKGYFPENDVDHIDQDKSNNKWENLREVSKQCNMRNRGITKNNTSGVTGVCWNKKGDKWCSYLKVSGKRIHLGYYINFDNAVLARWKGEVKYGFPYCNTYNSSSYKYLNNKGLI